MKCKIVLSCLLLSALLLSGCQSKPDAQSPEPDGSTTAPAVTEESRDSAVVSFQTIDQSVTDADGSVLVNVSYCLPQLEEETESDTHINQILQDACDHWCQETAAPASEYSSDADPENPYECTVSTEAMQNEDGILSFRFEQHWFMGGVENTDLWGMTFDLNTGEEISLSDLTQVEPAVVDSYIRDLAYDDLLSRGIRPEEDPEFFEPISLLSCDTAPWYLKSSSPVLCFGTYGLGFGFEGAIELPCPDLNLNTAPNSDVQSALFSNDSAEVSLIAYRFENGLHTLTLNLTQDGAMSGCLSGPDRTIEFTGIWTFDCDNLLTLSPDPGSIWAEQCAYNAYMVGNNLVLQLNAGSGLSGNSYSEPFVMLTYGHSQTE